MIVGSGKRKAPQPVRNPTEVPPPQPEAIEQLVLQTIENRDYSAAATYIEFVRDELNQPYTKDLALWHGYSLFHLGEYSQAIDVYKKLLEKEPDDTILNLYISSCHFYNQDFEEARAWAEKGPSSDFRTRLLFHIAHQTNDEQQLFQAHSQLIGTMENQLSLAAIHYMRSNYTDAIDIYQRMLQLHPDFLALNVYIAMCQFKSDDFQNANDSVDQYLAVNSDSAVGLNVKACAYLRMFDAEIAESQLLQIRKFSSSSYSFIDSLIKHNLVIFHNGEDGFVELPKLTSALNDAKYNLALLYMRENNPTEAYHIMQDFHPIDIPEIILKAGVILAYGQLTSDPALLEEANATYAELGEMEVTRDSVPGRQCLMTTKFIYGLYDEAMHVLSTFDEVMGECDELSYNKGMTYALLKQYPAAEEAFLQVKSQKYTSEIFYTSWLCKCYIQNRKYTEAWDLYANATQTEDAKTLLQIIANDCYRAQQYYYSMRAYDVLLKFEGDSTMREGMIASAIGVFRDILARKETSDKLSEVIAALSSEPEAESVLKTIQDYIETSGEFDTGY